MPKNLNVLFGIIGTAIVLLAMTNLYSYFTGKAEGAEEAARRFASAKPETTIVTRIVALPPVTAARVGKLKDPSPSQADALLRVRDSIVAKLDTMRQANREM